MSPPPMPSSWWRWCLARPRGSQWWWMRTSSETSSSNWTPSRLCSLFPGNERRDFSRRFKIIFQISFGKFLRIPDILWQLTEILSELGSGDWVAWPLCSGHGRGGHPYWQQRPRVHRQQVRPPGHLWCLQTSSQLGDEVQMDWELDNW